MKWKQYVASKQLKSIQNQDGKEDGKVSFDSYTFK